MKENVDYELIIHDNLDDTWGIRFLQGPFIETIVAIGALAFNEVKEHLSFNFEVIETPDPDYVTSENVELQEYVGEVLNDILHRALDEDDGGFKATERNTLQNL